MSEIKKPKWDKPYMRSVWRGTIHNVDEPLTQGMKITAKYKGKNIHMKILNETSDDVFESEIFDIEPNATTYEGLSINDVVEIRREDICSHQKKK